MRISVEGRRLTFAVDASAVAPAQEEDHLYPKAAASKSGATVGQAGTPGARATNTPTTPHVIAHAEALPRTVSATATLGSDASPLALTDRFIAGVQLLMAFCPELLLKCNCCRNANSPQVQARLFMTKDLSGHQNLHLLWQDWNSYHSIEKTTSASNLYNQ